MTEKYGYSNSKRRRFTFNALAKKVVFKRALGIDTSQGESRILSVSSLSKTVPKDAEEFSQRISELNKHSDFLSAERERLLKDIKNSK